MPNRCAVSRLHRPASYLSTYNQSTCVLALLPRNKHRLVLDIMVQRDHALLAARS